MSQRGKARVKRPLALVYREPASCSGCSEAAAALLQSSRWDFAIQYVGPQERLQLSYVLSGRPLLSAASCPQRNNRSCHLYKQDRCRVGDALRQGKRWRCRSTSRGDRRLVRGTQSG